MKIVRTIEFDIEANTHRQITKLRNRCFRENQSEYSYYKQLPHFRYLTFDEEKLVGHLAVDHRVIRLIY